MPREVGRREKREIDCTVRETLRIQLRLLSLSLASPASTGISDVKLGRMVGVFEDLRDGPTLRTRCEVSAAGSDVVEEIEDVRCRGTVRSQSSQRQRRELGQSRSIP